MMRFAGAAKPRLHTGGLRSQLASRLVRAGSVNQYTTAEGLTLNYVGTRDELALLYRETLGGECSYLQHGVRLARGATVLDIGANIGLFCLRAAKEVGPAGTVIGVEPGDAALRAAEANIAAHTAWCAAQAVPTATPTLVRAAVSDRRSTAQFHAYPRALGWSTLDPDPAEVRANMAAFVDTLLDGPGSSTAGAGPEYSPMIRAARWMRRTAPTALATRILSVGRALAVEWMLGKVESSDVRALTVSDLIREHSMHSVDLLKVDIERGEARALAGIEQQHWPLIRQVSAEVHDADGRLPEVLRLLRTVAGFTNVMAVQEPGMRGTNLYLVHATRGV